MIDNNCDTQINQNNPNIVNNIENLQQPVVSENLPQNNNLEAPKNKLVLIVIIITVFIAVVVGIICFFILNKKPKSNSRLNASNTISSNVSKSSKQINSNVPFASEEDKKYIDETNKQYGIRFNNQVVLTTTVPIDWGSSYKPKSYDGLAAVAIDVSGCNHIYISSKSLLTCYLDKAEKNYYNVVFSSNDLGAFRSFSDIAHGYEKKTYPLTSMGIVYDDVNAYTEWYKIGLLHVYFGHTNPNQYNPYFYVTFNKASTEKDASFDSEANVNMFYKKMSIINVPHPASE